MKRKLLEKEFKIRFNKYIGQGKKSMKPKITSTSFGSITFKNKNFEYDIIIDLDGEVKKRKKKLSKKRYGTSHKISLNEARYIYKKKAKKLIIGSGQTGYIELSKRAKSFFKKENCKIKLLPTPKAIELWNRSKGKTIAMFHVTC
jgi:hypothetical protein